MSSLDLFKRYFKSDGLGNLIWVESTSVKVKVGSIAGSLNKKTGYHQVRLLRKLYYTHRIIYSLEHNIELTSSDILDHIDGDKGNNRPDNLRSGTYRLNNCNLLVHRAGKSPCVEYNRCGTFRARLSHDGKRIKLGTFKTLQEAEDAVSKYKADNNLW